MIFGVTVGLASIVSNNTGSFLWDGRGNSNDDLYGNTGTDKYIYSYGNGQDNIYQAGSEDIVNLLNISLEQIAGVEIKENGVPAQFTDGGSLNIERQVYQADYQNKTWS